MSDYSSLILSAMDALRSELRLIDVRKAEARRRSGQDVIGAAWVDPYALTHDHSLWTSQEPLAFFCVHGHEVSQFATAMARLHKIDAVYVMGGFEALRQIGAELQESTS